MSCLLRNSVINTYKYCTLEITLYIVGLCVKILLLLIRFWTSYQNPLLIITICTFEVTKRNTTIILNKIRMEINA